MSSLGRRCSAWTAEQLCDGWKRGLLGPLRRGGFGHHRYPRQRFSRLYPAGAIKFIFARRLAAITLRLPGVGGTIE